MTTSELDPDAIVRQEGEAATDGEELLSMREVAKLLGVSRQRAMVLAAREGFPAHRLVYVPQRAWTRADVQAYADARNRADALGVDTDNPPEE